MNTELAAVSTPPRFGDAQASRLILSDCEAGNMISKQWNVFAGAIVLCVVPDAQLLVGPFSHCDGGRLTKAHRSRAVLHRKAVRK